MMFLSIVVPSHGLCLTKILEKEVTNDPNGKNSKSALPTSYAEAMVWDFRFNDEVA
jgi:hypothetical protein